MCVEVVHYQTNDLEVGIILINEPLDLVGPVCLCPVLLCIYIPIFSQRLIEHEDAAGSIADVFRVLPQRFSAFHGNTLSFVRKQLEWFFVHT
ncbi:hypothetical protein SDC9_114901 [bioreactor metagenome]|uniref:Uncharacterized protein n=1 Tax=bioreactor metagenome TaxID=1076179 RepID=A0A645BRM0_9ZZZZ